MAEPRHWQERAREVEDRLSDALHARLTQRFVDRRTAALTRRINEKSELAAWVAADGEVLVKGHGVGRLVGFRFVADASTGGIEAKTLRAAGEPGGGSRGRRAFGAPMRGRERRLLTGRGRRLSWAGAPVARLALGGSALRPAVKLLASELGAADARERVRRRLSLWLDAHISAVLAPLTRLAGARLEGAARGIAFQLVEAMGSAPRRDLAPQLAALAPAQRARLRRLGVRFGEFTVFVPATLKPRPVALKCLLYSVRHGLDDAPPPPPRPGVGGGGRGPRCGLLRRGRLLRLWPARGARRHAGKAGPSGARPRPRGSVRFGPRAPLARRLQPRRVRRGHGAGWLRGGGRRGRAAVCASPQTAGRAATAARGLALRRPRRTHGRARGRVR